MARKLGQRPQLLRRRQTCPGHERPRAPGPPWHKLPPPAATARGETVSRPQKRFAAPPRAAAA
eukprot:1164615-Lingulodinium_polyedra.AAC.1